MLDMRLGLGLRQACLLSPAQKLALKELQQQEQKLRHPEYPDAAKGVDGLRGAHGILKERGAVGLLIGGLSEAVWSQRRTEGELYSHKDVDVMVLGEHFEIKDFYGGIDWWIPRTERITFQDRYGTGGEMDVTYYRNGFGAVLSFGAKKQRELPSGLYIPDSKWVVDMREAEATANVEVELDGDVLEKFRKYVRRRVRTRVPSFIRETFPGYILSPRYESDPAEASAIELFPFDLRILIGIHRLEERVEDSISVEDSSLSP